ncbi:MAG: metal-dependent hydrolase [Candidatus Thorarchaeota archaeon]
MSPGYTTHFLAGFLIAYPFYRWDKKDRLKTLVLGAFAGIFPDVDGILKFVQVPESPTLQFFFSHRGFWHSLLLPILFAVLAVIFLLLIFQWFPDRAKDLSWTLAAVSLAWLSHDVVDFSFTPFPTRTSPVWIYPLSDLAIYSLDQISAFVISILFGWMLWTHYNPLILIDPSKGRREPTRIEEKSELENVMKTAGMEPMSRELLKTLLVEHKITVILALITLGVGALIILFLSLQ